MYNKKVASYFNFYQNQDFVIRFLFRLFSQLSIKRLENPITGLLFSKSIAYEQLGKYNMCYIYYSISLIFRMRYFSRIKSFQESHSWALRGSLSFMSVNRTRRPKVDIGRTSVQNRLTVDLSTFVRKALEFEVR